MAHAGPGGRFENRMGTVGDRPIRFSFIGVPAAWPERLADHLWHQLHLLVTLGGVIVDFELAPANATDLLAICLKSANYLKKPRSMAKG